MRAKTQCIKIPKKVSFQNIFNLLNSKKIQFWRENSNFLKTKSALNYETFLDIFKTLLHLVEIEFYGEIAAVVVERLLRVSESVRFSASEAYSVSLPS